MNSDRMNFKDLPKQEPLQQTIFTGKAAEGKRLNQAARIIRENTGTPIILIFGIGNNGTEIGGASDTKIPQDIVLELITRLTTAMHGYLSEQVKPEDDNDVSPA